MVVFVCVTLNLKVKISNKNPKWKLGRSETLREHASLLQRGPLTKTKLTLLDRSQRNRLCEYWLWPEIKPRFCKISENCFFGDHLKVQVKVSIFKGSLTVKLPLKIEKMRVDLHRVTWLWWIKNQKSKIFSRRFNDDNLIKINFTYVRIFRKISQLVTLRNFII